MRALSCVGFLIVNLFSYAVDQEILCSTIYCQSFTGITGYFPNLFCSCVKKGFFFFGLVI